MAFFNPFEGKDCKVRLRERCRGYIVRLETRGKEFTFVANRLILVTAAKANHAQQVRPARHVGVKAPQVTGVRPEAGRSSPRQNEALRKQGGGSLPNMSHKSIG